MTHWGGPFESSSLLRQVAVSLFSGSFTMRYPLLHRKVIFWLKRTTLRSGETNMFLATFGIVHVISETK